MAASGLACAGDKSSEGPDIFELRVQFFIVLVDLDAIFFLQSHADLKGINGIERQAGAAKQICFRIDITHRYFI